MRIYQIHKILLGNKKESQEFPPTVSDLSEEKETYYKKKWRAKQSDGKGTCRNGHATHRLDLY